MASNIAKICYRMDELISQVLSEELESRRLQQTLADIKMQKETHLIDALTQKIKSKIKLAFEEDQQIKKLQQNEKQFSFSFEDPAKTYTSKIFFEIEKAINCLHK